VTDLTGKLDAVFVHTHLSGLWDASKDRWAVVLRAALSGTDILTITEWTQKPLGPEWFKDHGFTLVEFTGYGREECAIAVRDTTFKVTDRWCIPISKTAYALGSGKIRPRVHLAGVELEHRDSGHVLNVEVFHTPSAIEGRNSLIRGVKRVRALMECFSAIRAHRKTELAGEPVLLAADWNLNLKLPWVAALLKVQLRGLRSAWKRPFPKDGSHGKRLIDGVRISRKLRALGKGSRLRGRFAPFDHRMVRTVLGLDKHQR
jgi:hypothetical protein